MSLILSGTNGLSDVDGSAATPAIRGTDTNTGIFFPAADTVGITTGGTERARVDSSGNLGLGVTPSAWGSGYTGLDIKYLGISNTGAGTVDCSFTQNGYYNGTNWIAKYTSPSKRYSISDSGFIWYNGASATAGNAITFTQAMTLDNSGNLAINDTSFSGSWNKAIRINGSNGSSASDGGLEIAGYRTGDGDVGAIAFYNAASSNVRLAQIYGERSGANNSGALTFHTTSAGTGSERARITSNGFFKASNNATYINSSGNYHEFVNGNSIDGISGLIACFTSSSVGAGTSELLTATYRNASPNNTTHRAIVVSDNANNRMIVYSNGNIQNANNSYGALSDAKIKENIVDATPKLAKLCQVRIVNYNVIGETQKQIGVVAQELEQLFPSMVDECPDYETVTTVDEDGNERSERVATGTSTKGVKYSVFVPMLIKAIQEQQAIITQLQADVAALKGNA